MRKHYNAIVIGTGQAGPPFADRLDEAGMNFAVIERGRVGGTCVNVGCVPTRKKPGRTFSRHLDAHPTPII